MAEKETQFPKKAVTVAASLLGLGLAGGLVAGEAGQRAGNEAVAQESYDHQQEINKAFHDTVEQAVNAQYDKKALVGEVEIANDKLLEDGALDLVEHALGSDVYNSIKGRIYKPIQISAATFAQHTGDTYDVVEVDLNPQDNDGNEYIVVDPSHVIDTEATTIPTPETH